MCSNCSQCSGSHANGDTITLEKEPTAHESLLEQLNIYERMLWDKMPAHNDMKQVALVIATVQEAGMPLNDTEACRAMRVGIYLYEEGCSNAIYMAGMLFGVMKLGYCNFDMARRLIGEQHSALPLLKEIMEVEDHEDMLEMIKSFDHLTYKAKEVLAAIHLDSLLNGILYPSFENDVERKACSVYMGQFDRIRPSYTETGAWDLFTELRYFAAQTIFKPLGTTV